MTKKLPTREEEIVVVIFKDVEKARETIGNGATYLNIFPAEKREAIVKAIEEHE